MAFPEEDGAAALPHSSCSHRARRPGQSFTTGTASLADAKQVLNHLEPGNVHPRQANRAYANRSVSNLGFRKMAWMAAVDLRGKYESFVTGKSFTAQVQSLRLTLGSSKAPVCIHLKQTFKL